MNLIDKVKSVGRLALVGAVGITMTSCEIIDEGDPAKNPLGRILLGGLAGKAASEGNMAAAAVASAAENELRMNYERQTAIEAAREGRSTVNVNVNPPQKPYQQPQQQNQQQPRQEVRQQINISSGRTPYSVAFLYIRDKDGDSNKIQVYELEGISDSFNLRYVKKVSFGTQIANRKGDFVSLDLYTTNSVNPELRTSETEIDRDGFAVSFPITDKLFREKGINGRCTANFMIRKADEPERYKKLYDSYNVTIVDEP